MRCHPLRRIDCFDRIVSQFLQLCQEYPRTVTILNRGWRVIECRHGIQWILQRRNRAETRRETRLARPEHCRTKEALICCCDEHAGQIDPAARMTLAALPERISSEIQTSSKSR